MLYFSLAVSKGDFGAEGADEEVGDGFDECAEGAKG